MPNMNVTAWKPGQTTASRFLFLCSIGLFVSGLINLLGGKLSLIRIALFGLAVLVSAGIAYLGWVTQKKTYLPAWRQKLVNPGVLTYSIALTSLLFLSGWFVIWTSLDNFGKFYYYLQGAYPFIVWATCASGVAVFLMLAIRYGIDIQLWLSGLKSQRIVFIISGAALFIFGLLAWAASNRVVGVLPGEEDFWSGAGVPVLTFQVFTALIIGFVFSIAINKLSNRITIKSIVVDSLIWGISAWLWAKEPVKPDFLITQPVAPNYEMYPDYDARMYDLMSQFAVIGQGINNHGFFDRVLYPAFLAFLHDVVGQDYVHVMAVQAGIFAIIPALIFLIGNSLYSRAGGISIAVLTALRGVSNINVGNIINTSHQKQMLTEYPTAVLLILATFLLIKWLQNPSRSWTLAGLAGAVIGLSTLVRPHTLVIIPIFLILAFFVYRHKTRIALGVSALFLTAALFSVIPWVQFGGQDVSIFSLYYTRIQDVIRQRYPQNRSGQQPGSEIIPSAAHLADYSPRNRSGKTIWEFTADNFLNNLVTTVQFLPTSPFNLDAHTVVKKTENFWKPYWDGSLTPWASLCTIINLILLALGLGAAWRRGRWVGLFPLIILIAYYLANSLSRTSGGRYLVPVDWVVLIYYVFGLLALLEIVKALFIRSTEPEAKPEKIPFLVRPWWLSTCVVLLVSFSLGSVIPLVQSINPLRFAPATPEQQADKFVSIGGSKLNLSGDDLKNFLNTQDAVILTGRSLFPRQFAKDEGMDISVYNFYHPLPYPRTLFTILGQAGQRVVILPRMEAAKIPNSTDVMVLGCQSDGYIIAFAVIRLDDKSVFGRTPSGAPLACPLTDPICDNNKSCH